MSKFSISIVKSRTIFITSRNNRKWWC